MPPRKSVGSNPPEDGADGTPAKAARESKDGLSVEDLSLPKSMIARLAKGVLPPNTQIHKDALLALHKSATVFVSYIASNSNENAQSGGKKTIAPQDVMAALKDCELEEFIPRLEAELKKYNEVQCDKRNTYRRKVKEEKAAAAQLDVGEGDEVSKAGEGETVIGPNGATNGHAEDEDEDRPAKKFKALDGSAVGPDANGLDDEEMDDDQGGEQNEGEDQLDEDDEDDGDDGEEDEDQDEEDDEPVVLDPDRIGYGGDVVDEALDDPDSDSE